MIFRIFFLCLLPLLGTAVQDILFDESDPTLCHNVNVITGHLQLTMCDHVIKGPIDLPLMRTYTSADAQQRDKGNSDIFRHRMKGLWTLDNGWTLFPQIHLSLYLPQDRHEATAYLTESSGSTHKYVYSHRENHDVYILKTKRGNNRLRIDTNLQEATLFLANGGKRTYKSRSSSFYYHLTEEKLPSGHLLVYTYNKADVLEKIELKNPQGTKTFSWVQFDVLNSKPPFTLSVRTSDGKQFYYNTKEYKDRYYLKNVDSHFCPKIEFGYSDGRSGIGARLESATLEGKLQFKAHYYLPQSSKEGDHWKDKPSHKPLYADKVKQIDAPLGTCESFGAIASFTYHDIHTDVRDAEWILTRYYYHNHSLAEIIFFDEHDHVYALQQLKWENSLLKAKLLLAADRFVLLAKTFHHDDAQNICEEIVWGNITGKGRAHFQWINDKPYGAESFCKTYEYLPEFNVKTLEAEEDGPTVRFEYLLGTNLLTAKLTYEGSKILLREFFIYDQDHLLVAEITDDGNSVDLDDLSSVTERRIKRYTHHSAIGLPESCSEYYWDGVQEILLKSSEYRYQNNQIIEEKVFDSSNTHRYTLVMTHDDHGNLRSKTDPLGQTSTYDFNTSDQLIEEHEIGSPSKILHYDSAGRVCKTERSGKEATALYDAKGRAKEKTDFHGNTTTYRYDAFSRCLETSLPSLADEEGELYTPLLQYGYNLQGYRTSDKDPRDATTKTFYTVYGKLYRIIHPDGTETWHTYNKQGSLVSTLLPDGTTTEHTYDIFQRKTSQRVYSSQKELLSEEIWVYNTFHLTSYTDPRGLTTRYVYDKTGRKIREEAEDRVRTFTYDALGFLERTSDGCTTHVQIHNVAGQIIEEWLEDDTSRIENKTTFTYENNKKASAKRITSQKETLDTFTYDDEGRLFTHTDPDNNITQFIYTDTTKTTIDPLGNKRIETFDAANRLIAIENQDAEDRTHFKEEIFYDRSNNKARILSTQYNGTTALKTLTTRFTYNLMGQLIRQIDSGGKTTTFDYFPSTTIKTLPNGIFITTYFDGLIRPTELISSDHTLHYTYHYNSQETTIEDHIFHHTLIRTYNLFGDLLTENTGCTYEYDQQSRCKKLTLPDSSFIHYTYTGMHMTSVTRYNASGDFLYEHAYTDFDPNGHVAKEQMIHNLGTITTTHDHFERIKSQTSPYFTETLDYGPTHLVEKNSSTFFGDKTYTYDPINQLSSENSTQYPFDSLGNRLDWEHSDALELKATDTEQLDYDKNGNLSHRITPIGTILYKYDALDRLIEIHTPDKTIRYTYDPLSRLYSKQINNEDPLFYLYDHEKEIGTSQNGIMQELKILGLGIKGDIGAAIALELSGTIFAPLHDLRGNIIAIVAQGGTIAERYDLSAFGHEEDTPSHRNPWRFSSKRSEETGLIYFGLRFYDPTLGRFLTTDPAGYTEGINFYLFVLNNPINRLDLFGLRSETFFPGSELLIPIEHVTGHQTSWATCRIYGGLVAGIPTDHMVGCTYWHLLKFTPVELESGFFNLYAHFEDLMPKGIEGNILLNHPKHGINNSPSDFLSMCQQMYEATKGTLLLGFYSPTFSQDFKNYNHSIGIEIPNNLTAVVFNALFDCSTELNRVLRHEMNGVITPRIQMEIAFIEGMTEFIHTNASGNYMLGSSHSEGGLVLGMAIESMSGSKKKYPKSNYLSIACGSARPLSNEIVKKALDYYSDQDFVTGRFAKPFLNDPNYDIRIVPCISKWCERSFYGPDHGILGTTYREAYKTGIVVMQKLGYKFYDGQSR